MNRKYAAFALLAAACHTTIATADFTEVVAVDVSSELGTPGWLTTFRLYAQFDDPTDQLLAVNGDADVAALVFSTDAPGGLYNDPLMPEAGLKASDFPFFGAAWDSWVTIGSSSFTLDNDYSPGFLGGDGVNSVILGSSWSQADNGGWFDADPSMTPELAGSDLQVLIAQFTIASGFELELEGTISWNPGGNPPSARSPFVLSGGEDCDIWYAVDPTCTPANVDGNSSIGLGDLLAVLSAWGPCAADFELTGQSRVAQRWSNCTYEPNCCDCYSHTATAGGFNRFNHFGVLSVIRDDGFELSAYHEGCTWCAMGASSGGGSEVQLSFVVHDPLPFAFVAQAYGFYAELRLTGPGGFELTPPVDTEGILVPGSYSLISEAYVSGGDVGDCDWLSGEYTLDLDGTRCAPDIDGDGDVGFRDLLMVLERWGPCGMGACCLPLGSCVQADAAPCAAQGGVYFGDDTLCADVVCPWGACCLPSGSCVQADAAPCAAQGGVYFGDDTLCADVVCAQPGACCRPNGSCFQAHVGGANCDAVGGVYFGDDTLCTDVVCPWGACCLPSGSCVQADAAPCAAQGGVYFGDDTLCAEVVCTQPGACCLPDGACVQSDVGGASCTAAGGIYFGDDTLCADVVCTQPGACCLPDGACVQSDVGGASCTAAGGVYFGDDTLCADVVCAQPGACCLPDGSCVQSSDLGGASCLDAGGVYFGDDTLCADVTCTQGACCLPDTACFVTAQTFCLESGGTFFGQDSNCATTNCIAGACCLPDGTCYVMTPEICDTVGGTHQGGGSVCETVSCP